MIDLNGERDRARTGDPQLGKLAIESWASASKSSSCETFKTDLVPAGNRPSRLDGVNRAHSHVKPSTHRTSRSQTGTRRISPQRAGVVAALGITREDLYK